MRYSFLSLINQAMRGQRGWPQLWRKASLRNAYDVVIIGGGGHGLATAYYLAAKHGVRDVAVLERGWVGGGNTGRNTTIIRSNYYFPASAAFYDLSLQLYEGLSKTLNFNVMFSQRGILNLLHRAHDLDRARQFANAMQINGVDTEIIDRDAVAKLAPSLDVSSTARIPVIGGLMQKRGGVARHDAVAWGYARAADSLGVDIVENCNAIGFQRASDGSITAVKTNLGEVKARSVVMAVAGSSSLVAEMAGFQLPISTYTLQAMVSEPVKPCLDTVVLSPATGIYVSQSDKGELVMGSGPDRYTTYAQRGGPTVTHRLMNSIAEQFPSFGRLRLLRQWGGAIDSSRDSTPILGASPVPNLFISCGWGTGGFKAIPAGGLLLAHHVATGKPHPIAEPFALSRFYSGALMDEGAMSTMAH